MNQLPIRIGIVGAGTNTQVRHIPGLQAIPGVTIVSVCNRRRESAEQVARKFGITTVYSRWEELVEAKDTDAILIGTWPYLHHPVTLAALAAGKHVLCEARLAMNATEARQMLAASRANPKLVAQVVPAPFTLRVDATVQRLLAEGYVGNILAVEVRAGNTFLDEQAPLHWRQDATLSGHNILALGIWYEAILRWLGPARSAYAAGKVFVTQRRDATGQLQTVKIPEHLDVVADLTCGAQAHFQISSVTGLARSPEVFVFGTQGTLYFTDNRLFGGRRSDTGLQEIPIPANEEGRWRVEEEFINAIRGIEPVRFTTFATGVQYMEFTDAVVQSLATGATVPVPIAPTSCECA